jgi:hypothetical protein
MTRLEPIALERRPNLVGLRRCQLYGCCRPGLFQTADSSRWRRAVALSNGPCRKRSTGRCRISWPTYYSRGPKMGIRILSAKASPRGKSRAGKRGREFCLLHRHRLGQVPGLVYVTAAAHRDVISQQLQGHDLQNRQQFLRRRWNMDYMVCRFLDFFIAFGRQRDHFARAGFYFSEIGNSLLVAHYRASVVRITCCNN